MLKALETKYNGRLFRSRLEARWAVFFGALGIPYVYEYAFWRDLPEKWIWALSASLMTFVIVILLTGALVWFVRHRPSQSRRVGRAGF